MAWSAIRRSKLTFRYDTLPLYIPLLALNYVRAPCSAAALTMAAFQSEGKKVACKRFIQYVKCFVYPKIFELQETLKQDTDFSICTVKNCNSYRYCQKLSSVSLYSYERLFC